MPTFIQLTKYRELHVDFRQDKEGTEYLTFTSFWRKRDRTKKRLGGFALYPESGRKLVANLKKFQNDFESGDRPRISLMRNADSRESWRRSEKRGAFFCHRQVSKDGKNLAVVTFSPQSQGCYPSEVWIYEEDLSAANKFIESQLSSLNPPAAPESSAIAAVPDVPQTIPVSVSLQPPFDDDFEKIEDDDEIEDVELPDPDQDDEPEEMTSESDFRDLAIELDRDAEDYARASEDGYFYSDDDAEN